MPERDETVTGEPEASRDSHPDIIGERVVPVTISLSQKLYERFGEDITRELVNWFNTVDAAYREELRQHNDLNFARFESKLAEGLAQMKADLGLDAKLAELKADLLKWMFGFWATTTLALVALALRR